MTNNEEVILRKFMFSRFPEFSFENSGRHHQVIFSSSSSSTSRYEWHGTYGDVSFVFKALRRGGSGIVHLRCVGLWQNWLVHENWSIEREAEIRSRIPYEEELIDLIKDIK